MLGLALAALASFPAGDALVASCLGDKQQPQPCPCLTASARQALAESALRDARNAGLSAVQRAAARPADAWTASLRAIAGQAERELRALRAVQLRSADAALREESDREAAVVRAMLESIREAQGLQRWHSAGGAAAWGRSRARNELARLSLSAFNASRAEEGRAEGLRRGAIGFARAAAAAASKMVEAAREAKQIAQGLVKADATRLVASTGGENRAALAQVRHALRLSELAQGLVRRAKTLASSALSRAVSAEENAVKALNTARNNTRRIAKLKARVQAALQQAQAAG